MHQQKNQVHPRWPGGGAAWQMGTTRTVIVHVSLDPWGQPGRGWWPMTLTLTPWKPWCAICQLCTCLGLLSTELYGFTEADVHQDAKTNNANLFQAVFDYAAQFGNSPDKKKVWMLMEHQCVARMIQVASGDTVGDVGDNRGKGYLGGGFKYFLFSTLFGEDFQFD